MVLALSSLAGEHDWRLVIASLVCFAGSLGGLSLFYRARQADYSGGLRWIMIAATVIGIGTWTAHLIATSDLKAELGTGYAIAWSGLSLLVVTNVIGIGLAVAVQSPRWSDAVGGAITGAGISTLHAFNVWSLELSGGVLPNWSTMLGSLAVSTGVGIAAMMIVKRGATKMTTLVGAFLITATTIAQRLIATSDAQVVSGLPPAIDLLSVLPLVLTLAVAFVACAILGIVLTNEFADQRLTARATEFDDMMNQFAIVREQIIQHTEQKLRAQNLLLDGALNNMSQGLCMFDAEAKLVIVNERYIQMYGLSHDAVKPGCTLRDLLVQRAAAGNFSGDPDQYVAELKATILLGECMTQVVELDDGRTITISNRPTAGGGWVATHNDLTDQRRAERELDRTRAFLHVVIENIPASIFVKEASSLRYALFNRAAEELHGISRSEIVGKTPEEIFAPAEAAAIAARDQHALTAKSVISDEHTLTTVRNGVRTVTTKRLAILNADGTPDYLLGVVEDITERKEAEVRIAHMAHHDALTDLPNRAAFNERLTLTIQRARDSGHGFALFCMDLDRFKEVNDVFGHAAGDALLREVSRRLRIAAEDAFLARLGGDEFIVISSDGPQPMTAEVLAEQLLRFADEEFEIEGRQLTIGLSIGVAIFPTDGSDAETLLANADAALYRAKAEGRGSIRFFEADMDKRLRERRALQLELRSAVEKGELTLHYQPQARMNRHIVGFETLARWLHPSRGIISPADFIPLAEESGLIVGIGEWILRAACREAASWPNPLPIAINLSPAQFRQGDLPAIVHSVLLETGLAPHRLELEITEGVLIDDFSRAGTVLRRLKALGVRIALDDFGTGYSSLSYLHAFPFDKIKIDRSFIANLEKIPQSAAILRAVIALVHSLDRQVVAEGVETEAELRFLAAEACDEVQGYLIGRPLPIENYADVVGPIPARWAQGA